MKLFTKVKLSTLLLFAQVPLMAQTPYQSYHKDPVQYREHVLDITKMKVEVSFLPEIKQVNGKVSHSFVVLRKTVDSIFFDGPGIQILKASLNGKSLSFKTNKQGVWVYPASPLAWSQSAEITFEYTARPKKGIYFIGWNQPEFSDTLALSRGLEPDPFRVRRQIWTQGQGIDNRHWIPMYDDMNDKFVTETVIKFDSKYKVLSNGLLKSKTKNKDGSLTWHYAMSKPHAGYLLMLAIGNYEVQTAKSKSGVPLQYWYYPEFKERVEPTFRHTPMMVDFMEEQTGIPYPWESYSQVMVQDFMYGAMENTTATIFGDFFFVDNRAFSDKNYIGVNCHELTHQWFGDYVTARDGRDAWLQESFATFYPKQLTRVLDGEDEWNWQRRQHQVSAVEAGKKDNFAVRHSSGGTARVYPKGAAVLSMLVHYLGEEQWKRVLKYYLQKHAYGNVETNDLQQAIKDVLGMNLDWFFDQWIHRGGEPHYRIHYEDLSYQDGSRATEIAIEQIHPHSETLQAFRMPITFEVHYTDGSKSMVVDELSKDFEVVKIPNPNKKAIAFVLFDPNSNVLKQVTFKKSLEELKAQLQAPIGYLDRYDALLGLRAFTLEQKRAVLVQTVKKEKHYAILNEAISQLAVDTLQETYQLWQNIFNSSGSLVRAHLLKEVGFKEATRHLFEKALTDSSYEVVKNAMMAWVEADEVNRGKVIEMFSKNTGVSMNHALRIKYLETRIIYGYASLEGDVMEILDFASPKYEFRTRVNAFQSLRAAHSSLFAVLGNEYYPIDLFEPMLSFNGRLSGPAAELCRFLCQDERLRLFFKRSLQDSQLSAEDKEIIRNLIPLLK